MRTEVRVPAGSFPSVVSQRRPDPDGILAANVRRRRENLGWNRKRLCAEASLSPQTLKAVEDGAGCSPAVERKLVHALRTVPGRLWEPVQGGDRSVHRQEEARWYFGKVDEATRHRDRMGEEDTPLRLDHDDVQDPAERARLGKTGLSAGFVRVTTAVLDVRSVMSSEIELYGEMGTRPKEGMVVYVRVLAGRVLFHSDGATDALGPGDVLQGAVRGESWLRADGGPARLVVVELDALP